MKMTNLVQATIGALGLLASSSSFGQVIAQDFSFIEGPGSESSVLIPCEGNTITLRTSNYPTTGNPISGMGSVPHDKILYPTRAWIPEGSISESTEILVEITFETPVNHPRVAVGDIDNAPTVGVEWLHTLSTGFAGISAYAPGGFPLAIWDATLGRVVAASNTQNAAGWLEWEGCHTSISFVYHRPVDLGLFLYGIEFERCTDPEPNCTQLEFYMNTDGNGTAMHWEIRRAGCDEPVCAYGDYANNEACQTTLCCLPDGDYVLEVFNDNGGTFTGQYVLRSVGGGRIVDNPQGFSGTSALHGCTGAFSLPMGTTQTRDSRQDRMDVINGAGNALITENATGGSAGMTWWIYDPAGTSCSIFIPRGTNSWSATAISGAELVAAGVELDKVYNARAICTSGAGSIGYGPATTFMVATEPYNSNNTLCRSSRLVDNPPQPPSTEHSCDVVRTASDVVWAPLRTGYREWRFEWTPLDGQVSDPLWIHRATPYVANNRYVSLGTVMSQTSYNLGTPTGPAGAPPASYGPGAWMVRVQTRRSANSSWCELGECCRVTIIEEEGGPPEQKRVEFGERGEPTIWPNPSNGNEIFMDLSFAQGQEISVAIFDVVGRSVFTRVLPRDGGGDLSSYRLQTSLGAGMHLVRISSGGVDHTRRIVVE